MGEENLIPTDEEARKGANIKTSSDTFEETDVELNCDTHEGENSELSDSIDEGDDLEPSKHSSKLVSLICCHPFRTSV